MNKKCVHDINKKNNTVSLFPRRTMAVPDTIYGVCVLCHKSVNFIREHGKYVLKEVEDDENG